MPPAVHEVDDWPKFVNLWTHPVKRMLFTHAYINMISTSQSKKEVMQ